eukprot:6456502-Prymnesium_polylepis.1
MRAHDRAPHETSHVTSHVDPHATPRDRQVRAHMTEQQGLAKQLADQVAALRGLAPAISTALKAHGAGRNIRVPSIDQQTRSRAPAACRRHPPLRLSPRFSASPPTSPQIHPPLPKRPHGHVLLASVTWGLRLSRGAWGWRLSRGADDGHVGLTTVTWCRAAAGVMSVVSDVVERQLSSLEAQRVQRTAQHEAMVAAAAGESCRPSRL